MDYLDTSKAGGYPIYIDKQIAFLQDTWRDHINALTRRIPDYANKVAILQGCEKSDAGGGLYDVAAGVVFFKGELVLVDAHQVSQSGTHVWYTEEAADASLDPKTMTDGSQANVHKRRRGKIGIQPQTGEVLESAVLDLRTTDWVTVSSEFGADYSQGTFGGIPDPSKLRYRKKDGYLELEGACIKDVSNAGDRTVFTLPTEYRPSKDAFVVASHRSVGLLAATVFASGVVQLGGVAGSDETIWFNARIALF